MGAMDVFVALAQQMVLGTQLLRLAAFPPGSIATLPVDRMRLGQFHGINMVPISMLLCLITALRFPFLNNRLVY